MLSVHHRFLNSGRLAAATAAIAICITAALVARGGLISRVAAVGGVSVDTEGVLRMPEVDTQRRLHAARQKALNEVPAELGQLSKLRKISLSRLDKAIGSHRSGRFGPLPDEINYLAGLHRIRYVFVYPDQNDIVLAGPAEGWVVDGVGSVVGQTSGQPVLLLEDLLIALRSIRDAAQTGIRCSIEPTTEGLQRLHAVSKRIRTAANIDQTAVLYRQALGPQRITVEGVPEWSHFSRVMVAADFRMKRMAMHFEPAPVEGMPSYLQLARAGRSGSKNMQPRWWLTTHYDPLLTDGEGLAWELRGQAVRCVADQDLVLADGTRKASGRAGGAAAKWAENMTTHFDQLAARDSIFGQLRNVIDLSVVAALIEKEGLIEKSGAALPYLSSEEPALQYNAPKQVDTQVSLMKKGRNWMITASGGVQIDPWAVVQKTVHETQPSDELAAYRDESAESGAAWWWD